MSNAAAAPPSVLTVVPLTDRQRTALKAARDKGGAWYGRIGSAMGGAYSRMCEALAARGLVEDHAPFPITEAGRRVLAAHEAANREAAYRRGEAWAVQAVLAERASAAR